MRLGMITWSEAICLSFCMMLAILLNTLLMNSFLINDIHVFSLAVGIYAIMTQHYPSIYMCYNMVVTDISP